jgi:hypothetical protein
MIESNAGILNRTECPPILAGAATLFDGETTKRSPQAGDKRPAEAMEFEAINDQPPP